MFVEQAIFTSLKTRRQEGYQLAAVSPGLSSAAAKKLAQWGPAHDSLVINDFGQSSLNFQELECGEFCVSRTIAAGSEYSGRAGPRIYTQILVVPRDVLAKFANNPFAVIEAAAGSGQMPVHDVPPPRLEPVRLIGRASLVNQLRLAELAADPGVDALLELVAAAAAEQRVAVRCAVPLERLYHGLFSLLPLKFRLKQSFSTGLRFSPRRPVRLLCLSPDTSEQRNLERSSGAKLLDFTRCSPTRERGTAESVVNGSLAAASGYHGGGAWVNLIRDVFLSGHLSILPEILRRADHFDAHDLSLNDVAARVEAEVHAEAR